MMTARGWLSTWSANASKARVADTIANVKIPTLLIHATGDTEIRLSQAHAMRDAAGSDDVSYHELKGADHYLSEGPYRRGLDSRSLRLIGSAQGTGLIPPSTLMAQPLM